MSSATMDHLDQFYRTNDMALVTFLRLEGQVHQAVVWEHHTCYWIFERTNGLSESIDAFNEGIALVEPKAWSKMYNITKTEFHESRPPTDRGRRR